MKGSATLHLHHTTSPEKALRANKKRKCIATTGRIPVHLEHSESVACFRLTTDHDYLQAHLHPIGLASDGFCPLCQIANMDGDHLRNCTEFIHVPHDIIARYWEAWLRMTEQLQSSVGLKKNNSKFKSFTSY
ncbi:hypothetical protein CDAR_568811 [Caerostris darwini]|uniref:Uncharacterized protein n=1 Tax=Caerostris darwini TaxID=1538125 RepID=A0AAV4MFQ0_9ARAC|nr:hypothetical protein CDAR_568811 [Caerostris darwini]